jgi:hypothetical protein
MAVTRAPRLVFQRALKDAVLKNPQREFEA